MNASERRRICYPNGDGLLSLAEAIIKLAVKDVQAGRSYYRGEPDPKEWLEQAGLWHLAQHVVHQARTIQEKH